MRCGFTRTPRPVTDLREELRSAREAMVVARDYNREGDHQVCNGTLRGAIARLDKLLQQVPDHSIAGQYTAFDVQGDTVRLTVDVPLAAFTRLGPVSLGSVMSVQVPA